MINPHDGEITETCAGVKTGTEWDISNIKINQDLPDLRKHQIRSILEAHKEAFAKSKWDIGCAKNGLHAIPTNCPYLIAANCYMLPQALRAEADLNIEKMLRH